MDELLSFFISEPEKEIHIRKLAKLTKKSPTTISKHLNELKVKGFLTATRRLNHLLYKANADDPAFKDLKLTYNIKKIRESGLIEYLNEGFSPEAIILFGSFRKAEDLPESDVDILVITPSKKDVNLAKFEKKLGHKIQLFIHSRKEIEGMKTKNKDLLNTWLNGIVLEGFWEVFR